MKQVATRASCLAYSSAFEMSTACPSKMLPFTDHIVFHARRHNFSLSQVGNWCAAFTTGCVHVVPHVEKFLVSLTDGLSQHLFMHVADLLINCRDIRGFQVFLSMNWGSHCSLCNTQHQHTILFRGN
jgi:hypothetical protein